MISIDGAGLLAQVIPVAVLVLTIEIARVEKLYAATRGARIVMIIGGAGLVATILLSLNAELLCILAVSAGKDLRGADAVWVGVGAELLWVATTVVLLQLVAQKLGFYDWLGKRSLRKALDDPEATYKRLVYIARTYGDFEDESEGIERWRKAAEKARAERDAQADPRG